MSVTHIRLTAVVMDVLDVLASAPPHNPAWGLQVCKLTGHGTGTVYPALDRLMKAGWISDHWENPPPADRPPRRFYEMTGAGRAAYRDAMTARAARRAVWARPQAGETT